MSVNDLPTEVLLLIINHLRLSDIKNIVQVSFIFYKSIRDIDWEIYYLYHIRHDYIYGKIDRQFLIDHGRYLLDITDNCKVQRYYQHINHVYDIHNQVCNFEQRATIDIGNISLDINTYTTFELIVLVGSKFTVTIHPIHSLLDMLKRLIICTNFYTIKLTCQKYIRFY